MIQPESSKRLSALFFLSCVEQFLKDSTIRQKQQPILEGYAPERELRDPQECPPTGFKEMCRRWTSELKIESLLFAFKCSISLGLAVLIGLIFNKENSYWSGLTIAISFAEGKQAIFTMANARAQGTAMGSVYGVLGCFVFEKLSKIRFVALLPWIIFTSFLRHSRMYGRAGGNTAVIGALLILGRNNYGPANEFAIARLTEAVIGLTCFIFVELLLQPITASTLAKRHLCQSLGILQECMTQVVQFLGGKTQSRVNLQALNKKHHHFTSHVDEFEKFIEQAELEPNFWFSPFRGSIYRKLHESLSSMADLLDYMSYRLELVLQVSQNQLAPLKELQEQIDDAFKFCNDALCSSLRCVGKDNMVNSDGVAQEEQEANLFRDLENGNFQTLNMSSVLTIDDKQIEKIESYFLQQFKKGIDDTMESKGDAELRLSSALPSLGFCISCFMRRIRDTQMIIKELIPWEITQSYL